MITKGRNVKGTVKVTFELPKSIEARKVMLCGDFNEWSTDHTRMTHKKDGSWQVTVPLEAGQSYRYKFLLDGHRWENDWAADGYIPNGFGGDDSVVNV